MLNGYLYAPKNPEYAAVRDIESTKDALDSMLLKLRALNIPVSPEEMSDVFCQRLPEEIKKKLILNGSNRFAARAPNTDTYQAVYDEAPMIEGALRAAGACTPRDTNTPGVLKRIHGQRVAALGDGSRRGDDDSLHSRKPSPWDMLKGEFCLSYAARALHMGGCECDSG